MFETFEAPLTTLNFIVYLVIKILLPKLLLMLTNNQSSIKAMTDKRRAILNEGNPSQIDLTSKVQLERTFEKIKPIRKEKKI